MWNLGTSTLGVKGVIQVEKLYKDVSTKTRDWGGLSRSSDETSVMEVEQRG